ncbi:MAG: ferredoxin family protein [Thermoplasmata archaeon]
MSLRYWRTPLDKDKVKTPRGRIYIVPDRCKGCGFCVEFCPKSILEESREINKKGYHPPMIKNGEEDGCINCSFCMLICPEFAIFTKEDED